jgi:hypothetical protein
MGQESFTWSVRFRNAALTGDAALFRFVAIAAAFAVLTGWSPRHLAGQMGAVEELGRWAESLPPDPRVFDELHRFETSGGPIGEWAQAFTAVVRAEIFSAARDQLAVFLSGECSPSTKASIGNPGFTLSSTGAANLADIASWKKFRQSLIYTETVACFQTTEEPGEVLQAYAGQAFRMRAESRITSMWEDSQGTCLETKGVLGLVAPTKICNRIHDLSLEGLAAQHSQVVFNEGGERYQDVYFKESLKTFVQIPGGVALHYVNVSRAADLGRIKRWIGAGQIEDSQNNTIEEFQRWLLIRDENPL